MKKLKCPFCKLETIAASMPKHLRVSHGKSKLDYLLETTHLQLCDIPLCKVCQQNPCTNDLFVFNDTCDNPECIKEMTRRRKSAAVSARHKERIANGTHNFLKQNREYDTSGKCVMNIKGAKKAVASGKCSILAKNRSRDENGNDLLAKKITALQIETGVFFGGHDTMSKNASKRNLKRSAEGKHQWQNQNLQKDENGKSIMHCKSWITAKSRNETPNRWEGHTRNQEDLNKEFFLEHFVKENRFQIDQCCAYFNLSISKINKLKRNYGIYTPNTTSSHLLQNQILDFISSKYPGTIKSNVRGLIGNYELDIYIPDMNLAIEFDGLKFHSSGINPFGERKDFPKNYHLHKTCLCEEKNIQLLHITDSEWLSEKQHIWKSVIANKLKCCSTIGARKCTLVKNPSGIKKLLEENHLQGYVPASFNYGLIYNNELVSVMTFNKCRFGNQYNFELMRFCCKCNISIVGGASRLLKAFQQDHPGSIVSYANRRWSNGNLYEKLGFKKDAVTDPDYFYFHPADYRLYHRMTFQKWKIKNNKNMIYDEALTEEENMYRNGYMKFFDCGNLKYVLNPA